MFSNIFSPPKSRRLWDNVEKCGTARQDTDDNIIRWMRIACCITKARNTHSEDVLLIALPLQQWLHERSSMLRLYVHCLSCYKSLMSFYQHREGEDFVFWGRKAVNILWTGNSIMWVFLSSIALWIWCDFGRASSLICGNIMPTRNNIGFYCRSYCLLNMFQAPLCPSSGAQEYYTVVAVCGVSCCKNVKSNL